MTQTAPDPKAEWWTTTDVATYLGVRVGTISSYRNRGQMPEPDDTHGRTHLWKPERIVAWHGGRTRRGIGGEPASRIFLSVSTATETREVAEQLAKSAVQAKLAASAQITGPAISTFWHLGEFGTGEEWRLVLQTHESRYAELEELIRTNHPRSNPEITAVRLVAGSSDYLDWVLDAVSADSEPAG